MASTYTPLGVELMATGENAGTWGTKTNVGLQIMEQIAGGYTTQAMTDGDTVTLTADDGSTGATCATAVIKLTGSLSGTSVVTVPDDITGMEYLVLNGTTGSQTVTFKTASGSGVSWSTTDARLLWHDGTNIVNSGLNAVTASSTTTFTNKTLTSPKIGTAILDTNGLQLALLTATSSAVNEITLANAATTNNPTITASGDDSNIGIALKTKGSGVIQAEDGGGTVAAVKIAGTETIFIPAQAMFGTTTNGADAQAVETTATRPELKVLDFDASTAEYAQFSIAMPKSWNLSTVTYQVFWSPSNTDTGNAIFGLQGLATTEGDTADAVFGTAIEVTDAGIGTVEDVQMTAVSSAMTIAGSPADDDYTFFQLYRDAADGSDTFTGDARVMGIKLFYTTDAANDA